MTDGHSSPEDERSTTHDDAGHERAQRLTRRGFLAGTVAAALAACSDGGAGPDAADQGSTAEPSSAPTTPATDTSTTSTTVAPTPSTTQSPDTVPVVASDPFTLGVASGDPLPDSVILWTRLHPAEALPGTDVEVAWQVARDPDFTDAVRDGTTLARSALGHSVHVDVAGLAPDTEYYFRFTLGEHTTRTARTRTFAAPGTTPERFRFAFSSCQNWEQGRYAAYRDVVEQDELDAFVFLGDYIYEYPGSGTPGAAGRTTDQDFECETLEQYRRRYALYHSDPLLQAAHARVPWVITWDDHEVDNDYAGAVSQDDDDPQAFLARRAAAYQAWYEHMPVRLDPPDGPDYAIHRSFAHGDLVRFHVLDTRQYRSDQQRGEAFVPAIGEAVQVRDEALASDPDHTMLGDAQRRWLIEGIRSSTAVWDVLAQQVLMFGGNAIPGADPPVVLVDTWDGYAGERRLLLEAAGSAADNLIVLTGDFHSAAVADLRADPFDQSLPVVGSEFMASSISSSFFDADETVAQLVAGALAANPQLKWFDTRRGYTLCEVTHDRWLATYRAVADQFDDSSEVDTISSWEVRAGTAGTQQVS